MKYCIAVVLLLVSSFSTALEISNEVTLENVIKKILKISPPDAPVGEFHVEQQPPKHMLELYHRFTEGRRASGETVRSITPNMDAAAATGLIFNISRVGADEEVRVAQLVLRRRRLARHPHPLHRKMLAPPCRVRLYQVLAGERVRTVPVASIPVPQVSRGGWHSLDITSAIRELLLSSPGPSDHHILGVRFEAPKARVISPSHFLDQRDNTSVFLMLFTDESSENDVKRSQDRRPKITTEHIEVMSRHIKDSKSGKQRHYLHNSRGKDNLRRHKNNKSGEGENVPVDEEENTDIKELINMNRIKKMKNHKKLFEDYNLKYDDERESDNKLKIKSNQIDELLENSETRRVIRSTDHFKKGKSHRRRSIYDNELPFEKPHIKDDSKSLAATPASVAAAVAEQSEDDDKNLIPYPPGMERKKKRKWRRGKKKNHRRKISDDWDKIEGAHPRHYPSVKPPIPDNQTCSQHHLEVNFRELGWSDWVIAPLSIKANYCAGSCSHPVPERVPVTNHAIIQSLVHDHGLHKGVPAACCVPYAMSPISILFLQDSNHVILKNYPNMMVDSCGCR